MRRNFPFLRNFLFTRIIIFNFYFLFFILAQQNLNSSSLSPFLISLVLLTARMSSLCQRVSCEQKHRWAPGACNQRTRIEPTWWFDLGRNNMRLHHLFAWNSNLVKEERRNLNFHNSKCNFYISKIQYIYIYHFYYILLYLILRQFSKFSAIINCVSTSELLHNYGLERSLSATYKDRSILQLLPSRINGNQSELTFQDEWWVNSFVFISWWKKFSFFYCNFFFYIYIYMLLLLFVFEMHYYHL